MNEINRIALDKVKAVADENRRRSGDRPLGEPRPSNDNKPAQARLVALIHDIESQWLRPNPSGGGLPNFAAVAAGCGIVEVTVNEPEKADDAMLFGAINAAANCHAGAMLAHAVSQCQPLYDNVETDFKIAEAKQAGPLSCDHFAETMQRSECRSCRFRLGDNPVGSPVDLGRQGRNAAHVRALRQYGWVEKDDAIFRLDGGRAQGDGLDRKRFNTKLAHVSDEAWGQLVSDELCAKPNRRDYLPGEAAGLLRRGREVLLNTYRPIDILEAEGDVEWFLDLSEMLFGDQCAYPLNALAHAYQRPGEKIASGLLMIGAQGVGKNTWCEISKKLFGDENCYEAGTDDLVERFRAHLCDRQILIGNEIIAPNQQGLYNALKRLVSDETYSTRTLHKEARQYRTPRWVIFISNADLPFRIEDDDRRLCIVQTPDKLPPGGDAILKRAHSAGDQEIAALAYFLRRRDLSGFDPKARPPMTAKKAEVIRGSKDNLQTTIEDAVEAREGPFAIDLIGSRHLTAWLEQKCGRHAAIDATTALKRAGVLPLRNGKQARVSEGRYPGPQRFWIVGNHDLYMGQIATDVRDMYHRMLETASEDFFD